MCITRNRIVHQGLIIGLLAILPLAHGCTDSSGPRGAPQEADGGIQSTAFTQNRPVDEIIVAALAGHEATLEEYWTRSPVPCSSGDASRPTCPADSIDGTLVRDGVFRCGTGAVRLDDHPFLLTEGWGLYSIQLDESVGLTYRIILSRGSLAEENAAELIIRTPKIGEEELFDVAFRSYSILCGTAEDATEHVDSFLTPPPEDR